MDHAQKVTKSNIQANMSKEEDYLIYLKRNIHVDDRPDIDSYGLLIIFQNYIKRL
jgi:hypothetical protein